MRASSWTPRFREACDAALALRDHSSVRVRRAVTDLLPRLAQYQPEAFSRIYLGGATSTSTGDGQEAGKSRDDDALRDAAYSFHWPTGVGGAAPLETSFT